MADKKLLQLTEQDSIGERDNGYLYLVNKDGDSRKLSLETLKSDVIAPMVQREIEASWSDVETKIERLCSRNLPDYHNYISPELKHNGNYKFYAPFDGILNKKKIYLLSCKINDVDVERFSPNYSRSLQTGEAQYTQVEFQIGDKIELELGANANLSPCFVPLKRTEIDRTSALIMEFDATPGELHEKIAAAEDEGESPFYWYAPGGVEGMGVYGSNATSKPSLKNISTKTNDWKLITKENESQEFRYYAIYCPMFADNDHNRYIFGY